jgi:hypothetical protein
MLLNIGVLLQNFGFITPAKDCFMRVQATIHDDVRVQVNLANLARDSGNDEESRQLYGNLLLHYPNNPVIRRNALMSLEYDSAMRDVERFTMALAWGEWAVALAGGLKLRPKLTPLTNRPLRIAYVSADFCQYTVGLFIKDVLTAHVLLLRQD